MVKVRRKRSVFGNPDQPFCVIDFLDRDFVSEFLQPTNQPVSSLLWLDTVKVALAQIPIGFIVRVLSGRVHTSTRQMRFHDPGRLQCLDSSG